MFFYAVSCDTSTQHETLSDDTNRDLKFMLDSNRQDIVTCYASYFRCIQKSITAKGISIVDLCSYVMSLEAFESDHNVQCKLLVDIRPELERAESTHKLLDLVAKECVSFMNIGILQRIVAEYELDNGQDKMKYPDYLLSYIKKHKISELAKIYPNLVKCNEKHTSRDQS